MGVKDWRYKKVIEKLSYIGETVKGKHIIIGNMSFDGEYIQNALLSYDCKSVVVERFEKSDSVYLVEQVDSMSVWNGIRREQIAYMIVK